MGIMKKLKKYANPKNVFVDSTNATGKILGIDPKQTQAINDIMDPAGYIYRQATKEKAAADTANTPGAELAGIYRDQWDDYLTRFAPLEDELIDTYRNKAVHDEAIAGATQQAAISSDGARESYDRNVARFGVNTEQMSREETDRAFEMARTKAIVDAKNRTRQALVDRDQGMLSGGITTGGVNAKQGAMP